MSNFLRDFLAGRIQLAPVAPPREFRPTVERYPQERFNIVGHPSGFREDPDAPNDVNANSHKGLGYFGPLTGKDGSLITELSMAIPKRGETQYNPKTARSVPTLVPTLSENELRSILNNPEATLPDAVYDKIVAHADERERQGRNVFAGHGEQSSVYPNIPRRNTVQGHGFDQ